MLFSWQYVFRAPYSYWFVSLIFLIVGFVFYFIPEDIIFQLLGAFFIFLGAVIFLLCLISLYFIFYDKKNLEAWYWWINFTGGVIGVLSFVLPAVFIYPIFAALPEWVLEEMNTENLDLIKLIFTLVGVIVAVLTFFVVRWQLKSRPRWIED